MSGQSAKSGEAIVRGLSLAIDGINSKGGLLGKDKDFAEGNHGEPGQFVVEKAFAER